MAKAGILYDMLCPGVRLGFGAAGNQSRRLENNKLSVPFPAPSWRARGESHVPCFALRAEQHASMHTRSLLL